MTSFRTLLRRSPFYASYKALGHYPNYWFWILRGKPPRTPHLVKQRTVREYAARYSLKILIETGTYYGEMVAGVGRLFSRVYSIEYDPHLAEAAVRRFIRRPNIQVLQGDSQQLLPKILKSINDPTLFWLDAGYYGWAGAQGDNQRLPAELDAILSHPVQGHIVLLDDARCLNGQLGSPTLAALKSDIESRYPGRVMEVKDDIVRIQKTDGRPAGVPNQY